MTRCSGCRLDASERRLHGRASERRRLQDRRAIVERDDGNRLVRRRGGDRLSGAFTGKRHLPGGRQAQRPVDNENGDPLRPAGRVQKRAGESDGQQQQRRDAQRQQQEFTQPAAPIVAHERAFQKPDVAERQPRRPIPREEVQENRRRRGQGPEQEGRKEERHQRRLRVARYSRSAPSSGCTVSTRQYSMPARRSSRP